MVLSYFKPGLAFNRKNRFSNVFSDYKAFFFYGVSNANA